jgi:hypothetical protein
MPENETTAPEVRFDGSLILGFVLGFLAGGVGALFRLSGPGILAVKHSPTHPSLFLETATPATPVDPVEASIAEGRAAAHRRRVEIGLEPPDR